MNKTTLRIGAAVVLGLVFAVPTAAQLSADQIARLGGDLTPLGGVRVGNREGTIPAWIDGIKEPPVGYVVGEHHRDPYPDDQPLFTIDASNSERYRTRLSAGHRELLRTYSSFKMPVYPTRRSASVPQRIYDATRRVAASASLVNQGNGVRDAAIGTPFPIPDNGLQVIWNHLLRYRGETVACTVGQAVVDRDGSYTVLKNHIEAEMRYWLPGITAESLDNKVILMKQKVLPPAPSAGEALLVHETMNQVDEPRRAWTYRPNDKRVRRAPNIAYDASGLATGGLRTTDQADMFNGAVDRYNWQLVGKREMYVPYNAYKVHGNNLTFADILTPLHPNPEHLRYELHRVWVVRATLKADTRHIYKRRTLYVDEDSWSILVADMYDHGDQIWRVSEGHVINYYEKPLVWATLEVHLDLRQRRYFAFGLDNEYPMCTWDIKLQARDFTPRALRQAGER